MIVCLAASCDVVRHVLQLAAAAVVSRVVRTGRIDPDRRRRHDAPQRATREMALARDLRRHDIAGRRARNEHDEAIAPARRHHRRRRSSRLKR